MWHDLFAIQLPVLEKIVRTVLVYAVIVALFRFSGKRGLANLNTLDLAVVLLLANVVQNAIIGSDDSITGAAIGALTLVMLNSALNHGLVRSDWLSGLIEGRETTVIEDGQFVRRSMRRLGLRSSELNHAVRLQNGDDVEDIQTGCLEPGGQLVLTLRSAEQSATKGDIAELQAQLANIQSTLGALTHNRER